MADARLGIVIDGTAARRSAEELARSLDAISAAATREAGALGQTVAAIARLAQSQQQAQASASQEVNLLQQKIAIQQRVATGALSAAEATRKMAEADIFARTGSQALAQQLAGLQQQYAKVTQAANTAAQAQTQAATQSNALTSSIHSLKGAFLALGVAFSVSQIIDTADSYRLLEGRLKLVTSSSDELASVSAKLFAIAQATSSSFESVVQTFTRTARAADNLGVSQGEILRITETLGNALRVSGASSTEASAAMLQLSQAFQSGVLQGDEFRSLSEQLPILLDLVAKQMGVTRGELKALGSEGKITGTILAQTLLTNFDALQAQAQLLPVTLGQAFTQLGNSVLKFAGEADKATGATSLLSASIVFMADHIDEAVIAFAAFAAIGIIANLEAIGVALGVVTRAAAALNIVLLANPWVLVATAVAVATLAIVDIAKSLEKFAALARTAERETDLMKGALIAMAASAQTAGTGIAVASAAFKEFQKNQSNALAKLKESNAELAIEATVWETAKQQGLSYAEALEQVAIAKDTLKTGSREVAEVQAQEAARIAAVKTAYDAEKKAAEEAAAATKKAANEAQRDAEAAAKINTELTAKTSIYKQVTAGILTLGEAEKKLAELQLVSQKGTTAQAKAFTDAKAAAEDYSKTLDLITKLNAEKAKIDIEDNRANTESLRALQAQGLALQEEGRLLAASLGPKAAIRDIEKEIALARIERTRQTELTTAKENELTVAEEEQINTNAELAKSLALATDAQNRQADALKNSILSTGDVSNAFKGLAQGFFSGTQNLKTLVPDFFKGLAITGFGKFIEQKFFSLDQPLIDNVNGLMGPGGVLSSLFSAGGNLLGSLFGGSAVDATATTWTSGFQGIFNGTGAGSVLTDAAQSGGASFGSLFGGFAAGAIGLSLGKAASGLFGLGKSSESRTGGNIGGILGGIGGFILGGPLGAAVGSFIGNLTGSFLGSLFEHIPTKGTRVRKFVVDFLEDIGVTFADEINSKNYFFKETKQLAEDMFGGDFLAASKKILDDKVGPELANQLKALGTFITADQASKLGKSVEQTGVTFGNLLVANLGIDAIPEAITEIVQKSNLTLDILVKKLNDLFLAKDISVDFFKDTIQGAVAIFSGALPDAIGVSKIAMKSFAEDGTFDLEKFKKAVEGATSQFDLAVQTFLDSVNNNAPGEAAAKAFGEGLKRGLDQLARDAFLQDFIENKLFAGIDFSDGLDSSEIDTLTQRTRDASIQADALAKALDNTGDAVDGLSTKIRDLNAQLQDLANQRVQIQVDLAGQLGSIGALTPTQVIAAREQPLIPTVDRALNARSPIGTAPFASFSDDELQAANDALKEMGELAVDRFNAESQAAEAALQDRIAAINTETRNTINAINQQTQATQDGIRAQFDAQQANGQRVIDGLQKQKDIQSRIFQDRIDGLQEELQAAQQFRQVSESIQQTINSLALSNSPLFKSEKLAFLQRQAGELRSDKSAEAIQKLSQNLASQLQVGQDTLSPEQFAAQFTSVIDELQTLRDKTGQQGAKAEDLQRNIEALQTQQTAILERIDAQITSQQQYLQSLSQNENNAIAAAQKAGAARITAAQEVGAARIAAAQAETKAAIDAYRVVIVARLNALAAARDEILKEQAFRLKNAADLTAQELTQLIDINVNTRAMKDLIASFLAANAAPSITPAATGFQGIVDRPRLFLAGEAGRESVSITPVGQGQNGGGGNVTFAPSISVTMQGSGNTEQDGKRLATAISQGLLAEWRRGALGKEIRDFVKR